MRIVCDCGEFVEFQPIKADEEDQDYANEDGLLIDDDGNLSGIFMGDIEVYAEHDEMWLKCLTCGKDIHIIV